MKAGIFGLFPTAKKSRMTIERSHVTFARLIFTLCVMLGALQSTAFAEVFVDAASAGNGGLQVEDAGGPTFAYTNVGGGWNGGAATASTSSLHVASWADGFNYTDTPADFCNCYYGGATAGYTANLEVSNATGATGTGYLAISFSYDGYVTESGSPSYGSYFTDAYAVSCEALAGCPTATPSQSVLLGELSGDTILPEEMVSGSATVALLPFTFGQPFPWSAYVVVNSAVYPDPVTGLSSWSTESNFSNTAVLRPFVIYTSDGAVDTAATVIDVNTGQQYAVAVPEPAIWITLLAGFGIIGASIRSIRPDGLAATGRAGGLGARSRHLAH